MSAFALSACAATRNKTVALQVYGSYYVHTLHNAPFTPRHEVTAMSAPIAYADRLTNRTLCPSCAFTRIDMASSEESGPIMRYDLDPDDTCPCDVCGTACAPDNVAPSDAE